jgi:tetrahydromethanopterin S-methyltransferase subunit G
METLYIVIGAFSSIFIFLLGYSVSGVFNGKKRMNELDSFIEHTDRRISEVEREMNQRIDTDTEMLASNITELDKDVYSHIDSRLDKLETKLKGMIPPANQELIERIKKMEEESYRLRMNM